MVEAPFDALDRQRRLVPFARQPEDLHPRPCRAPRKHPDRAGEAMHPQPAPRGLQRRVA
jgi:hypothetical protein